MSAFPTFFPSFPPSSLCLRSTRALLRESRKKENRNSKKFKMKKREKSRSKGGARKKRRQKAGKQARNGQEERGKREDRPLRSAETPRNKEKERFPIPLQTRKGRPAGCLKRDPSLRQCTRNKSWGVYKVMRAKGTIGRGGLFKKRCGMISATRMEWNESRGESSKKRRCQTGQVQWDVEKTCLRESLPSPYLAHET